MKSIKIEIDCGEEYCSNCKFKAPWEWCQVFNKRVFGVVPGGNTYRCEECLTNTILYRRTNDESDSNQH